jgi:hypothetical protein
MKSIILSQGAFGRSREPLHVLKEAEESSSACYTPTRQVIDGAYSSDQRSVTENTSHPGLICLSVAHRGTNLQLSTICVLSSLIDNGSCRRRI